jgi:5-methylcytosine-specific restriction protein A
MGNGWEGSTRKATLPPDWQAIRRAVLQRDGWRCTWPTPTGRCTERATDVDHVGDRDDHTLENLRALCAPHHLQHTSRQANTKRWATRAARPPEPHPGLNTEH